MTRPRRVPADQRVRVRVPATVANLGPGFDSFGLALDIVDTVDVRTLEAVGESTVAVRGEGEDGAIPLDESHLVVRTMRRAWDRWLEQPGVEVHCRNAIPQGRGLGSSAGAVVSGLLLAGALAPEERPDDSVLLALAAEAEGHPDNVAACLAGGATVSWQEGRSLRSAAVPVDDRIRPVVFVAPAPLLTSVSREFLPDRVPLADAAANAARCALLALALAGRCDLLLPATEDRIHQEARRPLMPDCLSLVDQLRAAGHAAMVCGAGPSVLVLDDGTAPTCTFEAFVPPGWTMHTPLIERQGAELVRPAGSE